MKINEIFYSLQGEGFHTGIPAVFVRFSGCNLKCDFCDTEHADGSEMTVDEIGERINALSPNCPLVILTGGEPSLFIDAAFVDTLKRRTGKRVAIETNGTNPLPDNLDWITVSPKQAPVVIERADEIKVVDLGQPLDDYFNLGCYRPGMPMFLQPCHVNDDDENRRNVAQTVERVMSDPRWRLSLQTHRLIGIS